MNSLQTDNLIALSLLINEEIYIKDNEQIEINGTPVANIATAIEIEKPAVSKIHTPSQTTTTEIPITKVEKQDFKYFGDNNKYILIIVNEPDAEFLKKEDLNFLTKIIGAKKWEIADIALINKAKYSSIDFQELKDFFAFNKIVTFGIDPKDLNIVGAIANKKSEFKNTLILGTWDLPKLQQDVSKKTIFWNELKTF